MKYIFSIRPEIIAFCSGAMVMIYELLGSRILGIHIGASLFVWTNIIAIILWALAYGYYIGWKLADKGAGLETISKLFFLSALGFFLLPFFKDPLVSQIANIFPDVRLSSSVASIVLFAPMSVALGMIPPIITKIKLKSLEDGGSVIGRFGSIGTVGSIIGTFASGFFLIPFFGVDSLLFGLAGGWVILSLFSHDAHLKKNIILWVFVISALFFNAELKKQHEKLGVFRYDTAYSHITVSDDYIGANIPVRNLRVDNITHAGMFKDSDELLYNYTKHYHLFDILTPGSKEILMLGGAAYSFPKSFLLAYPDKKLDVVEIDPSMTEIAREHFDLPDNDNLSIYHEDARVFLNTSEKKYDAILWDAFGSFVSIPYQLTTKELIEKKYDMLTDNGVVILNVISSLYGESSRFLHSEYKTYKEVFPEVFIVPVVDSNNHGLVQNVMLIAAKNPEALSFETVHPELKKYIAKKMYLDIDPDTQILTDDYAPVDYYIASLNQ